MKLFGRFKDKKENKVVLIKITNDTLPFVTPEVVKNSVPTKPEVKNNLEFSLKVAAVVVALFNGLLAIMGYVDFTGRLDTLGISPNEIDLGLPALLLQGYRSGVLSAYTYATDDFGGFLAVMLIPAIVFYLPVSRLLKDRRWEETVILCLILALVLMIISIAPNGGLLRGQESAYLAFEKQNDIDGRYSIRRLDTEKTFVTKEGPTIVGDTIFASSLYTYVLQGPKLYKIANRDNHIVSETKITAFLRMKAAFRKAEETSAIPKQPEQTPDTPATQSTPDPHHR